MVEYHIPMALDPDVKETRALWQAEERLKRKQKIIDDAKAVAEYGDGIYTGPVSAETEELKSDWERLATLARIKFPEHLAVRFNMKPQQRAVAAAWCLGWAQTKIAEASGLSRGTVNRYINDELAQEFIKAFNYHNAPVDSKSNVKELVDQELYSSVLVMKELRDDPSVSASTRADIAKWFWEQKFGKAKEAREIRGVNLRELTETLNKQASILDDAAATALDEETN